MSRDEDTLTAMHVIASHVRPTDTGVDGALDVDVEIAVDGCEFAGEVTLVRRDDRREEWAAWGGRDHWVQGALLRALDAHLSDRRVKDVLEEVEAVAAEACAEVVS